MTAILSKIRDPDTQKGSKDASQRPLNDFKILEKIERCSNKYTTLHSTEARGYFSTFFDIAVTEFFNIAHIIWNKHAQGRPRGGLQSGTVNFNFENSLL